MKIAIPKTNLTTMTINNDLAHILKSKISQTIYTNNYDNKQLKSILDFTNKLEVRK